MLWAVVVWLIDEHDWEPSSSCRSRPARCDHPHGKLSLAILIRFSQMIVSSPLDGRCSNFARTRAFGIAMCLRPAIAFAGAAFG